MVPGLSKRAWRVIGVLGVAGVLAGAGYAWLTRAPHVQSSYYPGPQLEFLAAASDFVAFVDPDDIEFVETTKELTGYQVRVYQLAAGSEAPVPLRSDSTAPAPTRFMRDPEFTQPIEKMYQQAETLMIFFAAKAGPWPDAYFGNVVGLDAAGDLVPLDGEEVGDLLTAEFEALRSVAEERSLALPQALAAYAEEARARSELPTDAVVGDTDGEALYAAVEAAAAQDTPSDLEAWDATPRNGRNVFPELAPASVMEGRENLLLLVRVGSGTTEGRQNEAIMLADADGVLYGWDVSVGTHTAGIWLAPASSIEVLYTANADEYLTATKIGEIKSVPNGQFGIEVVVDATSSKPAVTLGRTFADAAAMMEAEEGLDP